MIPAVDQSQPDSVDLHSMTKTQLLSHAAETGATGINSRMTKAQIIEALEG